MGRLVLQLHRLAHFVILGSSDNLMWGRIYVWLVVLLQQDLNKHGMRQALVMVHLTFSKPIAVLIQIGHDKNCFVFAVLV